MKMMQIKKPVVCGIASLGMDHTEILGEQMFSMFAYYCILVHVCDVFGGFSCYFHLSLMHI